MYSNGLRQYRYAHNNKNFSPLALQKYGTKGTWIHVISFKNNKLLKRGLAITLAVVCMTVFSGCNTIGKIMDKVLKSGQSFDEFVAGMPAQIFSGDSFDLNFIFDNPENFGIEATLPEYSIPSKEDHDEDIAFTNGLLGKLRDYNYNELTESQRLTYSIIEASLKRSLLMEDYYYLDTSYLGSYLGFQAQLPLLLSEYRFNDKNDVEGYFHLLETTETAFMAYAKHEKERQAEGVGMSQHILDKTIEQCENFVSANDTFLTDSFNERIALVEFFTEEEKAAAIDKNKNLLQTAFVPSYTLLKNELSTIKSTIPDGGLFNLPNGVEYYEKSLQVRTGMDMTIDEIQIFLSEMYEESTAKFLKIMQENPDAMTMLESGNLTFTTHKTPEETIDYLEERVKADFPLLPQLNYTMTPVPPSMQDNFSPAAYMSSRIDSPVTQKESMFINGDYDQSLFSTMMHEAYPGHMYQSVYYKTLGRPAIDSILSSQGYSEGWATYVESLCAEYAPMNQAAIGLYQANQEATWSIVALMDIEVNANGMTREEFKEAYIDWMFGGNEENCNYQYDLFIEDPGNYLAYYLPGLTLIDMRNYTEGTLGDQFSLMEFHKLILDCGPVPFTVLDEKLDEYILSKSAGKKDTSSTSSENVSLKIAS